MALAALFVKPLWHVDKNGGGTTADLQKSE
jgi:hypothetical protein